MKTNLSIVGAALLLFMCVPFFKAVSQPVNKLIGDVVVPPPNVASLGKYTDVPVDLSSGIPQISIPIHELKQGPLTLPVSLSYHASGIRVAESASWVGAGWTLMAGGMVTRTVAGLPDEFGFGFYTTGTTNIPATLPAISQSQAGSPNYPNAVANSLLDGEPDIFSFNIGGYSGNFYINQYHQVVLIPQQDVNITYNETNTINMSLPSGERLSMFTITLPDGNIYHFGSAPQETHKAIDKIMESAGIGYDYIPSTWHLIKIESFDKLHSISLAYTPEEYEYSYTGSESHTQSVSCTAGIGIDPWGSTTSGVVRKIRTKSNRLNLIQTSLESVSFHANTTRIDLKSFVGYPEPKRLDSLTIQFYAATCKRFAFNYDYFQANATPTDYDQRRLRLLSLQEKTCNGSLPALPPHLFTYEGSTLPSTKSLAVDHWGYYNGADANTGMVPPTTLPATCGSGAYTYGSANRETNEVHLKKGVLTRITYPTGGHVAFSYEANDYKGVVNTGESTIVSISGPPCRSFDLTGTAVFNSQDLPILTYKIQHTPQGSCSAVSFPSNTYTLELYQTGSSTLISSYQFNEENNYYLQTGSLSSIFPQIQAGISYTFKLKANKAQQSFLVVKPSFTTTGNKKVGGLRIKDITIHDGISTQNDIVKLYQYTDTDGYSSGKLFREPQYGRAINANMVTTSGSLVPFSATIRNFSSSPWAPLSGFNGRHILYTKVKEVLVGNGHTEVSFHPFGTIGSPTNSSFPAPAEQIQLLVGKTAQSSTKSLVAVELSNTQHFYTTSFIHGNDNFLRTVPLTVSGYITNVNIPFSETAFASTVFTYYSGYALLSSRIDKVDNVATTSTYTYNPDPVNTHLMPESERIVNSDGKEHKTEYAYNFTFPNSAVRASLVARNLIATPWQTTKKVNGSLIDGTQNWYEFFNLTTGAAQTNGSNAVPRLYFQSRYEQSWSSSGTPIGSGWVTQGTINAYDSKGFPAQYTQANWQPENYVWSTDGRLLSRTFQNFSWQYEYHQGTRLVKKITDIDGQFVTYGYDAYMRLKTVTARGGNVVTNYTYQYKDALNPRNFIETTTTFASTNSQSTLTQRSTREYLDGLGRTMQNIARGYHPTKGANDATFSAVDVITHYKYDNRGRVVETTLPYPSAYANGAYYAPPAGTPVTITQYEASPLNRTNSITPPIGYATTTTYGANASAITIPGTSISFPAYTLRETKVTDADNRVSYTYTDRLGRTVLERQTNTSNTTPADTYTLYDDKSRVSMVIPPGATAGSTELTFSYLYSGDDLITTKKVPGAAAVNMRYNNRDQLVFTQDGNLLAQSKSTATTYDNYGRPLQTGFVSGFPADANAAFTFSEVLVRDYYDGFDGTTQLNLTTSPQYRGKVRRSETKVLGSANTFLHNTYTYDAYGRTTQVTGNNYLNTTSATAETLVSYYDHADNMYRQMRTHQPSDGATTGNRNIQFDWYIDHAGRNTQYLLTLDGSQTHLAEYNYNHKDELIERNLHSSYLNNAWGWLQSVDFEYNTMGWLTRMNSNGSGGVTSSFPLGCTPALPNPGSPARVKFPEQNDLFYLELRYDQLFSTTTQGGQIASMAGTPQKAGNISQMAWRVRGRDRQAYSFTYDHLSRLSNAAYYDVNSANVASVTNRYNESLTYDLRGNISSLQRTGYYQSGATCDYGQIDNLTYTYDATSPNRLKSMLDNAPTAQKSRGFNIGAGGVGYTYDANGNLKSDSYKGISNITYNHLNLPGLVTFTNGNTLEFIYDAGGNKLRKIVRQNGVIQYEQDYAGELEYRKNASGSRRVESLYHSEGRYYNLNAETSNTLNWRKEYNLRDHLGNNRLTFADKNNNGTVDVTNSAATNEILQETHYYPFGLSYEGPWLMNDAARDDAYKYNGKEWDETMGLYDYGARWYDPAVGRWGQLDPLAEHGNQLDKSPYAYAWNNPILLNDPDGNCPLCPLIPLAVKFIAGFASDAGTQIAKNWDSARSTGENLTDFNATNATISGGFSLVVPGGKGLGLAAKEVVINATESSVKQVAEGGDVKLSQVASDVAGDFVGGRLTKNYDGPISEGAIKGMERNADRANRVATGDPSSSGRAATARSTANAVAGAKNTNGIASTFVKETAGNTVQEGLNAGRSILSNPTNNRLMRLNTPVDNTLVRRTLLPVPQVLNPVNKNGG